MPETLLTERLKLRVLCPDDLDAVHGLFSSPAHTIGDGPIDDRAATLAWLERRQQVYDRDGLAWYGLWNGDSTFVGSCGTFRGDRCGDEPEIGYEIDLRYRRRGFAAEAAGIVTATAQSVGHTNLWATIRPANIASVQIVQGLGYAHVRSQPDYKGDLDYYLNAISSPV